MLHTKARASWGAETLQRVVHGDGEVAAAELVGVAWRGEEGSSARGSGPGGRCGAAWGGGRSRRWPAASHGGGQRHSAPAVVKQRGREVEEDCWVFLQIPKSSGIPL